MKTSTTIIFLLLFVSCSVTKQDLVGKYRMINGYKTELSLNQNNKFTFLKQNSIQALLKNENYITTQGVWEISAGNKLILQSLSDSSDHLLYKIWEDSARERNAVYFTFFNSAGDTLNINSYFINNQMFGKIHGRQPYLKTSIAYGDSLIFSFTGYKEIIITKDNYRKSDYRTILFPQFDSLYFNQAVFLIKHKSLIDIKSTIKFQKLKNGS